MLKTTTKRDLDATRATLGTFVRELDGDERTRSTGGKL
jgi:hypothetical protein